ncbi:MAG: MFS transporter [Bacillota bacterium]|nr:MFS transporter [Bacillota bacterium]
MRPKHPKSLVIEAKFAAMHSSYWLSLCAFSGFMAVYLSYYGFSDSMIGLTASLISAVTIFYQLGISTFCDNHPKVPLKHIILIVYLVILALVAILALVPMPVVMMLLVYSLTGGLANGMPGLYNAQFVQFINAGLPLNMGWPRGMSAILYALFAYFLGLLLESYTASILMPITLICIVVAIVMALILPKPEQVTENTPVQALATPPERTSLLKLLKGNQVLTVFLLSGFFMSAGQTNTFLFLTRIIEQKGGSEAALGLAMFLQAGVEMPAMLMTPRLLRRFRARAILTVSVTAYFIKSVIIYLSGGIGGIYFAMAFSVFCYGLYGVTSVYFVNDIVRQNEKVRAQSLIFISGALASIIGNTTAGVVVQSLGIGALNLICMALQAVAAMLMAYCAWLQHKKDKQIPSMKLPFLS